MSRLGFSGALLAAEPARDERQNRYEWASCKTPELIQWSGPMRWPSSRWQGMSDVDLLNVNPQESTWFEFPTAMLSSGVSGGYHICGVTRDSAGAALGIVTVQGFRTSDDLYIGECTSGPTGEYCFTSWTNAAHYLVAYQAGAPDVAGTTVNTLVPVQTRTY